MKKIFSVAGLLALLVIPLAGSASATTKPTPPKKICAFVLAYANVEADTQLSLFGKVLKKGDISAGATAAGGGDVYVRICATVDANVALSVGADGLIKVEAGPKGGVRVVATANLQTLLMAGTVTVDAKVFVVAHGTVVTDPAQLDAHAVACIALSESLTLGAFTKVQGMVLVDLELLASPPPKKY